MTRFIKQLFLAFLLTGLMLATTSCGSDDSSKASDDTGPTVDVAAGDVAVDMTEEDLTGTDAPDEPDVPSDPDVPIDTGKPMDCTPACDYAAGQYCDALQGQCTAMECTVCWKDKDCGEGSICINHVFNGGGKASICSTECQSHSDCTLGFKCDKTNDVCVPKAVCGLETCGEGQLGDPCEYQGSNQDCGECSDGLFCMGLAPDDANECIFDNDCALLGYPPEQNPDCAGGACGLSFCSEPCQNQTCPDGFDTLFYGTPLKCACVPVGPGNPGDPCPFGSVHVDQDSCGAKMVCLGINASEETDECQTADDCEGYLANAVCVEGHCGSSFCSPFCGDDGNCPDGFVDYDISGTCYCVPGEYGEAGAGEACIFGDVNADTDTCAKGFNCIGMMSDEEDPAVCETAADCPVNQWMGNPDCVDGLCASSFCSPKCDENDECESGFVSLDVQGTCFCGPVQIGDSGPGDPCPLGYAHLDQDACQEGLSCLGFIADEDSDTCETADDCLAHLYIGTTDCVDGYCASSFCSPDCDENEECDQGFDAQAFDTDEGDHYCYCAPILAGTSDVGEPCPVGYSVHLEADYCLPELSCLGFDADEDSYPCETDADCAAMPFVANMVCLDGQCGSGFCAGECDEDGECPDGYEAEAGEDYCLCLPVFTGEGEAGDTCPAYNIHTDSDYCAEDLECLSVGAWEATPACEGDDECPAGFGANAQCFLGHCGTSVCAPDCLEDVTCTDDWTAWAGIDGNCYCITGFAAGEATLGDPCAFLNVNLDAGSCGAGFACWGIGAMGLVSECETPADCSAEDYPGNAVCVDGVCGTSFCTERCTEDGECAANGFGPEEGDDGCWCLPL